MGKNESATLSPKQNASNEKVLFQGKFRMAIVEKFYDLDGETIPEGKMTISLPEHKEAEFKITKKIVTYNFEYSDPMEYEVWTLYMNGEKQDVGGEITGYQAAGDKLLLTSCTGAG